MFVTQTDQSFSSQRLAAQARKLNSFTIPSSFYGAGGGGGVWNDAEFDQGLRSGRDADDVSVDSLGDGGSDRGPTNYGQAVSGRFNTRAASRERQQRGKEDTEEDAHVTVGAVSLMVDKSNKRAARLSAKLKRLAMEKEELRDRYEALCKRERQVSLGVRFLICRH